ncbi:hypothetical protein ACSFBI_07400 [Variovorax sp. RB3P1]|uniref:hypothetical protein n=1 Tax=Variovorax sp. RB3P1 TaxID=3443732 RepID=UPI003F454BE7
MDELRALDERIKGFDRHIDAVFQSNEACQRIAHMAGLGLLDEIVDLLFLMSVILQVDELRCEYAGIAERGSSMFRIF